MGEVESGSVVITGGGGYLGYHIALEAARSGKFRSVVAFDVKEPMLEWGKRFRSRVQDGEDGEAVVRSIHFFKGSVCSKEDVSACLKLFSPVSAVVHSASVGISGAENLPAYDDDTEAVNVGGTRNVLQACSTHGVRALLFTSSVNVCYSCNLVPTFDGREDELPYQPLSKHTDHYSRTKQIAEELVLISTDKLVSHGNVLRTAAVRPGFIYGPYEQRHLPRMIQTVKSGYTTRAGFAFSSLQDMVHVDNAVQGHMRALDCLLDENRRDRVSGQAYFVTDGNPTNTFLFFMRHIIVAINGPSARPPTLEIPILLVLAIAWLVSLVGKVMGKRFRMPVMGATVTEIDKSGTTRFFSIDKARRDLGYAPDPKWNDDSWEEILESYGLPTKREQAKRNAKDENDNKKLRI